MQNVVHRNTITPQKHTFIMQGTDKLFLVYEPLFHKANSKYQLIMSADILDTASRMSYKEARATNSSAVVEVRTVEDTTLDKIIEDGGFNGVISGM
jgi:hypothetical protein